VMPSVWPLMARVLLLAERRDDTPGSDSAPSGVLKSMLAIMALAMSPAIDPALSRRGSRLPERGKPAVRSLPSPAALIRSAICPVGMARPLRLSPPFTSVEGEPVWLATGEGNASALAEKPEGARMNPGLLICSPSSGEPFNCGIKSGRCSEGSVIAANRELARAYAFTLYNEWAWNEMVIAPRQEIVKVIGPE